MKFLDAAYPQSVAQFVAALQHEGAQGFAYYVGGNYALNVWQPGTAIGVRDSGYQGMGIYVSTVAGRDGTTDGNDAASRHSQYRSSDPLCWDLEPGIFRQNANAALVYGRAWAAAVRTAGFTPTLYSTPDGCAYIGDK